MIDTRCTVSSLGNPLTVLRAGQIWTALKKADVSKIEIKERPLKGNTAYFHFSFVAASRFLWLSSSSAFPTIVIPIKASLCGWLSVCVILYALTIYWRTWLKINVQFSHVMHRSMERSGGILVPSCCSTSLFPNERSRYWRYAAAFVSFPWYAELLFSGRIASDGIY